jgi:hypothetical protein
MHAISYVWDYRTPIAIATIAIPAAIEAGVFLSKVIKNPEVVKDKFFELKEIVVESFSTKEKAIRTVFWSVVNLAILGTAAALPFVLLPTPLAIPVALLAISAVGRMLLEGGIQQQLENVKHFLISSFTKQEEETDEEFKTRLTLNVLKTVALAAVLSGVAICAGFLIPWLTSQAALATSIWDLPAKLLPGFMKTTAFAGFAYAGVGLAHCALATYYYCKNDKAQAAFHLTCGLMGFAFPFLHSLHEPFRFHHSIEGLLIALIPFRAAKFLGATIALDSVVNCFFTQAEYVSDWGSYGKYDYMNVFFGNIKPISIGLSAAIGWEFLTENLFSPKKQPIVQKTETLSV